MTLKENIYNYLQGMIHQKIHFYEKVLEDLKESCADQTKSSAGDKHETALAMLQIEQENVRAQLQDVLAKRTALEKINPVLKGGKVSPGSLIKTDQGYLFMSVALGKAVVDGITFMALSPQSPLGIKLMGLSITEVAEINTKSYLIESIE